MGIGRDDPSLISGLRAVVEHGPVEPECRGEDFADKPVGEAPATSVPYGYIYTIVPACWTILILQAFGKMVMHARELFGSGRGH